MSDIKDLHEGSPFSASDQNTVRRQVRAYTPIVGGPGISVSSTPGGGSTVALAHRQGVLECGQGVLADAAGQEQAFTDERYWFKPQLVNAGKGDDYTTRLSLAENAPPQGNGVPRAPYPLVASNLAEMPRWEGDAGTHLLAAGQIIQYFAVYDVLGRKRYVFWLQPQRAVVVQVTATATGGGKYLGQIIVSGPGSDVSTSTGLSTGDLGTSVEDCIILSALEIGKTTHDLDPSSPQVYFTGYLLQRNSDGTAVVVIDGFQTADCS